MTQPEFTARERAERAAARQRTTGPARNTLFIIVVVVCCFGLVGNMDYADKVDQWAEEKIARAERVKREHRSQIWSKRCEKRGMDVMVRRADTGPWEIHCVPRRMLAAGG